MAEQDSRERKYYVLRVISGKEDKVKEMLEREREIAPLKGYLFDVFIPTEKVMMQRGSKKRIVERPSMPGYMVIEAILNNDNIFILRNLPNVVGFLGMPKPEPLPLYSIILTFHFKKPLEHPIHCKSFAFFIIIKAFINDCSCLTGNLRCIVFTVICNYKNII